MTINLYTPLLDKINSPADLRRLRESQLPVLAGEIRDFLLHWASQNSGHFAASLGAVELTIALHYIYNTPDDRLVWDVGHQAYVHKILTGRKDRLHSIRKSGGLAPFPKREESDYDCFGVGHSSTSISAALGMSIAAKHTGNRRKTVAIIGDGGMTAGMAYEALNHGGAIDPDLLVILNDNEMSISPNVGAMSKYLSSIWSGKIYSSLRSGSKRVLRRIPSAWELARRAEEHVKGMVTPGTLFEELGFSYFGPIDGHNLGDLLGLLRNLQNLSGPRMLHIVTRKGQGYPPAEADACKFHGVGPFDPETGDVKSSAKPGKQSYTSIFSDWLVARGQQDTRLHAITPAMREGSGLVKFSDEMPDRYHDVGIAEQHSVTLAAGMARDGLKPVVAIYSTFLQRAYDQFIHDVAVQNLDVTFAVDRAGIVGADGATHTGNFDIAFCRCIPDVIMMAPANAEDMYALLNTAYEYPGPALVRYPRDNTAQALATDIETTVEIGTAVQQRSGKRAALLVFGSLYALAEPIAEELDLSLVNMRFIKPLDEAMIERMARDHECLVTLEDASIEGGAGSAVLEVLNRKDIRLPVLRLGLADCFPSQGSREQVLEEYGLDPGRMREAIAGFVGD